MSREPKIYALLAQQIIDDYEIKNGRCLEVGSGEGLLGLEIAKRTALHIYMVDINEDVLVKARVNIRRPGLSGRITLIRANVEQLPFLDDYFELVVSRGSIFFWNDKVGGLKEIYRVLKPGGVAFVGGGMSRYMSEEEKQKFIRSVTPQDEEERKRWYRLRSPDYFRQILEQVGICNFKLVPSPPGIWVEMRK